MATIQLVNKDGDLYYPSSVVNEYDDRDIIILRIYDAGDCDTIHWPFIEKDEENLRRALFDDREMGYHDDGDVILLPDGKVFEIDV